ETDLTSGEGGHRVRIPSNPAAWVSLRQHPTRAWSVPPQSNGSASPSTPPGAGSRPPLWHRLLAIRSPCRGPAHPPPFADRKRGTSPAGPAPEVLRFASRRSAIGRRPATGAARYWLSGG